MNDTADKTDRPEIALIGAQRPWVVEQLEKHFVVHHIYKEPDPLAALAALGPRIRGTAGHGMSGLTKAQMELLPNLEIHTVHGVGLETTDVADAKARGIVITTTPVLFDDVADTAIALALDASRRITAGDRYVREGKWLTGMMENARKFTGMRAGIVGLGRIGIEVANRLKGFKAKIGYVDPVARNDEFTAYPDAVALARDSDILFLCAAGGPKGAGAPIIGKDVIEALGPDGIFVNISRGWLVDEIALTEALVAGRLGGAGLDVFDDEPNVPQALFALDSVVLTPHIASATHETRQEMAQCVVDNLVSWFSGKGALTPIK